jgi:hypothetical protein
MQGFRLGSSVTASKVARAQQEEGAALLNRSLLSIDYASKYSCAVHAIYHLNELIIENLETADYLKEGDVGFKKPKASHHILLLSLDIDLFYRRIRRSGLHGEPPQSLKSLPPTAMSTWKSTKSPLFLEHETLTRTS